MAFMAAVLLPHWNANIRKIHQQGSCTVWGTCKRMVSMTRSKKVALSV